MDGEAITHAADAAASGGLALFEVVVLLAAAVVAVPLFKRLGLGSVLGYLAAGLALGPYGLGVVSDADAILHASELGVVMFLFIIGLEMEPSRLWALRRQIFGLGVIQVVACGALLTGVGVLLGFPPVIAFVAGMGFVMTSTAVVIQILSERGGLAPPSGQKIVSILLLEDLAIVPLLAIVALLAPSQGDEISAAARWFAVGGALAVVIGFVAVGRWILNPYFRILAASKAREVMTAAALLVVLGAALVMEASGLSMAMGGFLAGVLLSTSTFRHQLEADVEPFRGILLGLFFLAIGMSLELDVVMANWRLIAMSVVAYMAVKGGAIYAIARLLKSSHAEALERAFLMAQGGEFAFVLYTTAVSTGLLAGETNAILTATVIISMVLTPFAMLGFKFLQPRVEPSMDGVDVANGLSGKVLVIGFGRFGQIASQVLIARGHSLSIIDNDTDMIRAAGQFGFKIYYGDGTRLDILHAAGAANADLVVIAINKPDEASRIAALLRSEFPLVKVVARAFDRAHAMELVKLGVEFQLREMFESALVLGGQSIRLMGASDEEIEEILEGVRSRDKQRFEAQLLGGLQAGNDLLLSNAADQAKEAGAGPSAPAGASPQRVSVGKP